MSYTATHAIDVYARCPVNPNVVDRYEAVVKVRDRVLPVEKIIAVVESFQNLTVFQEDVTDRLAAMLEAEVWTRGTHSGIETICKAKPPGEPLPSGPDPLLSPSGGNAV